MSISLLSWTYHEVSRPYSTSEKKIDRKYDCDYPIFRKNLFDGSPHFHCKQMSRNASTSKDVMDNVVPFRIAPFNNETTITMNDINLRQAKICFSKLMDHGINLNCCNVYSKPVKRLCGDSYTEATNHSARIIA